MRAPDGKATLCRLHPTRAKWIIVPSNVVGHTLGERLALEGTDWANLRFKTPFDLALETAAPFLVERGIDPLGDEIGAARPLLDDGNLSRVMIIDLDAHQGDGTHALVGEDPRVGLFDIAGSSWIGEFDTDRVFYKVVHGPEAYLVHLRRLLAMLDRFKPELVQYQAGMDCHKCDPVGRIDGIDEAFLADRDRLVIGEVVARKIPIVINLAGGYGGFSERLHVQTVRVAVESIRAGGSVPTN